MEKRIFLLVIISVLIMPFGAQAGLFDKLKARAHDALQGSVNDVTDAVGEKVDEVTTTVDQKANDVTTKVGEKVNDLNNSVGAEVHGATNGVAAILHGLAIDGRGPYGPDVIGIRLGMSMSQAENIVRSHMQVGWIIGPKGSLPYASEQVRGVPKIFIARNGSEAVILASNPAVSDRVLGVRRVLFMDHPVDSATLQGKLYDKYGQPSQQGGLIWGDDRTCATYWAPLPNVAYIEGGDLSKERPENYMHVLPLFQAVVTAAVLVEPLPLAARVSAGQDGSGCQPVVQATLTPNAVDVNMADKGHLFELFDKAKVHSAPPAVTKVEF
jgi:hypothetical protein